jgi:hypothetical protein
VTQITDFIDSSQELLNSQNEGIVRIQYVIDAFNCEFKGEKDKVYLDFEKYLKDCMEQWTCPRSQLYSPIATGVQSSGHGKSKTMFHFAKSNFVVYVNLRNYSSTGIPVASPITTDFLEYMIYVNTAQKFLFNLIKASFEKMKEIIDNNDIDDKYQEFNKYQPWLLFPMKSNALINYMTRKILSGIPAYRPPPTPFKVDGLNQDLITMGFNKNTPLFIFIDEASSLLDDSKVRDTDKQGHAICLNKLTVMRRAIINLCYQLPIVFFLADTNAKITEVFSNDQTITPTTKMLSEGPADKTVYPSFFKFLYCDQFVPEQYISSLNDPKTLHNFILKRNPEQNLFLYGRSLWSHAKHPLELAKQKLICAMGWSRVNKRDRTCASLAILSVRTTLSFSFSFVYDQELVHRHLSTLFYIDEERKQYAAR